jgi:hypothetical protein
MRMALLFLYSLLHKIPPPEMSFLAAIRQFVVGLTPHRPRFDPRSDGVGFVAQGKVFSEFSDFPC